MAKQRKIGETQMKFYFFASHGKMDVLKVDFLEDCFVF
jgi:hypothetical protein